MPEQSAGLLGDRFESLAIRERPVTIVAFFTQFARVGLHPGVDIDRQFVHVRCNATDESRCILCDLGEPCKDYFVTPVYFVADAAVRALVISDAHQPHSLGPQYKDELMKGGLDKRFLCISRVSAKYTITSVPAKPGQEMGDRAIKKFLEDLEAGRIRLDDAIARYSNEALLEIESIRRDAEARGLECKRYTIPARTSSELSPR
jgi:hypothetical protein